MYSYLRVSLLLLLLAACRDPSKDTKSGETGDTSAGPSWTPLDDTSESEDDSSGSGDDSAGETGTDMFMPWDVPGFWTEAGPLEALFNPTLDTSDKDMQFVLYMATSTDGVNWEASPEPIMEAFNSLDLWVTDDGIILSGLIQPERGVFLTPGVIYGIESQDLVHWASHEWQVQGLGDVNNMGDPSLTVNQAGIPTLTYYRSIFVDGDPVSLEGDHEIWQAHWDGEYFVNDIMAYSDKSLVDPVVCTLDDVDWMLVNRSGGGIIGARGLSDGTFAPDPNVTWDHHSVPYCTADGDHLIVLSQDQGAWLLPQYGYLTNDGELEDKGPLYPEHLFPEKNCTSPVMAKYKDTWVTFCTVDWTLYLQSLGLYYTDTGGADTGDTGGADTGETDTGSSTGTGSSGGSDTGSSDGTDTGSSEGDGSTTDGGGSGG